MAFNGYRKRAPRTSVRLDGRMRDGFDWVDLNIRDLSVRGLMAEADNPPSRGHYVEIRRLRQILVGRVIWSKGRRFGVRLADDIDMQAVRDPASATKVNERRDLETRAIREPLGLLTGPSDWRWLGGVIERGSLFCFGAGTVVLLSYYALIALSAPLMQIGSTLS